MSEFKRFDILKEQINKLLQSPTEDPTLEFSLTKVIQDVANYCNIPIEDLPIELDPTLIAMCIQLIQSHNWVNNPQDSDVNSISEGDVSVSFTSPADLYAKIQQLNAVTDDFVGQLNQFRRLR